MDVSSYAPDWDTLKEVVEAMHRYAIPSPSPTDPLFALLLSHVHRPGGAQDVYALSAQFGPHALAVASSEHLLSLDLSTVSDEWADRCGAIYLKRMFFLHLGRIQALKRIVLVPLTLHASRAGCNRDEQQHNVLRPWMFATAQLVVEAKYVHSSHVIFPYGNTSIYRADLSPSLIEGRLNPIVYRCSCSQCAEIMSARIKAITQEWSSVKRTI
ncbi:hypothetical protein EXIGLDRAFT_717773 [Exidia glandulosa HHB12029]|uniref:Uncharacterized protein n=1 Tax=Exidia glandulosa HHB12029 TaxID=1314781 RepID=A0A165I582_EXIGL|nr:hypothetical protein EXIGLDRAFT_717773 [Exidia glandulosa HHB12029]